MSNINMEFNVKFDNEDYIITIQTTQDKLLITIEEEKNSVYWKKKLDAKTICDITSQMGSFKSFDVFTKMLLCALQNENENISLNFCSLNEIQQLSENKKTSSSSLNNSTSNRTFTSDPENSIKKYLMLVYTQFEKVVYPIQLEYLDKAPDAFLLQRTITRLKSKLNNNTITDNNNMYDTNIVNYSEYERIKNENKNLITKIKLLESNRQLGAVDNDDIYRNYTVLSEEYEQYKCKAESKIKMLLNSIDEIKEMQFRESKSNFNEKDKSKNKIADLQKKLDIASEIVVNERKQGQQFIDEKNKQIELLKKEIKVLKDNEKVLKVKITKLEKELELANRSSNYYKYNTTPKSCKTKSVHSNSYMSGFSTGSKKSSGSYVRKNLLPNNPYDKYKGLRGKNYKPFSFINNSNKKRNASNYSGSSVKSKTKSYHSNTSSKGSVGKGYNNYTSGYNKNRYGNKLYGNNNSNRKATPNKYGNSNNKPFSKPKVPAYSGKNTLSKNNTITSNNTQYVPKLNSNVITSKPIINNNNTGGVGVTVNNESNYTISDRLGKIQSLINRASKK